MTRALAWWFSVSVAWGLGYAACALMAGRRELTVPEAVECLAEAMVRERTEASPAAPPIDGATFAEGLARAIESRALGWRPGNEEAEPRGA